MTSLLRSVYVLFILTTVFIQTGYCWSVWEWLGVTTPIAGVKQGNRRGYEHYAKGKLPSKYSDTDYDTYYVEVPQSDWDKYKEKYNHDEGVKVWEFPSLWDGNIVVPNFYTMRGKAEEIKGKPKNDRTVQGLDNRIGIKLAVPFIGDFQWMREAGPGDFVPELGPGQFHYPGPGDVDAVGGLALRGPPKEELVTPPPVVDLTPFRGLQNYPWYTR